MGLPSNEFLQLARGRYEALPIELLITAVSDLELLGLNDPEKARKDGLRAFKVSVALTKLRSYRDVLCEVNEARKIAGAQMHDIRDAFPAMSAEEQLRADATVFKLSGQQDVYLHFFAICVNRIKVLAIIHPAMGMKKQAQDEVLAPFEELRHHYEHFEERLPGHRNENLFSHSESTRDHIVFGFETRENGKYRAHTSRWGLTL